MIKVKTDGSGGKLLDKTISVLTNDERNREIKLTVSGNILKFATIIPERVDFAGVEGEDLQTVVMIIPKKEYPFKILDILAVEKSNISYRLKEINTSNRTEYTIEIKNLKTDKGFYNEVIELVTDSSIRPKIKLSINALIREKPKTK